MRRVVLDENLPRSFNEVFKRYGFETLDIRDHGLRGAKDSAVFLFAKEHSAALATADVKFANRIHLFESNHQGIFLIRLPTQLSVTIRCTMLDRTLQQLNKQIIENRIMVIAPGILRIHNPHL